MIICGNVFFVGSIMKRAACSAGSFISFAAIVCIANPLWGQPFSRDLRVDVTVNQVGFAPGAAKTCVLKERTADRFDVIRTDDQPFMGDGIYHVSEYWTPMVAYTVWLMAMLQD